MKIMPKNFIHNLFIYRLARRFPSSRMIFNLLFILSAMVILFSCGKALSPLARRKPFSSIRCLVTTFSVGLDYQISTEGTPIRKDLIHSTIESKPSGRCIIVGDVHGCFDELQDLLYKCQYKRGEDHVIIVGDLVNKGPKNVEVLRYAFSEGFFCVRGNHDDHAIAARLRVGKFKDLDELPDYIKWVDDLTKEEADWMVSLPYTLKLPHFNSLIVHAGLIPGVDLIDQTLENMYKMRTLIRISDSSESSYVASSEYPSKEMGREAWAKLWQGPPHVFFGHDAKQGLQMEELATGLDTGCVYGRNLTAMVLPQRELVSVKALRTYVDPHRK